jgi:hypothetical protein
MKKTLIIVSIIIITASYLTAKVINEFNYQGYLREFGQPVTGTRNIVFKIFNQFSGGSAVETLPLSGSYSISITSGVFNKRLSPVDVDWRNGGEYYIEIIVENNIFSPRQKIIPQIYALHARSAEDVSKDSGTIFFSIGNSTYTKISASGIVLTGDITMPALKKLYLDGGENTYIHENTADRIDFVVGGATPFILQPSLITVNNVDMRLEATKKLYFDGGSDTYITEYEADSIGIWISGSTKLSLNTTRVKAESVNFCLSQGYKLLLDAEGGDDYIYSKPDNNIIFAANGSENFKIRSGSLYSNVGFRIGSDSDNYMIDDSSNGSGSSLLFIGNKTIDTSTVSDIKTKKDIRDLNNGALSSLLRLKVKKYKFKKEYVDDGDQEHTGMIAQDVEKIFPEAIIYRNDGLLAIDNSKLVPLLIKSIQELNVKIEKQTEEIKAIRKILNKKD